MAKIKQSYFVTLAEAYQTRLSNGQRAELKRATLENISTIPAYYQLLSGIKTDAKWDRIVYFLPYVKHNSDAKSLGEQLAKKITEVRLFQVLRSDKPNDLIQLRRLVQQIEPTVDWHSFGNSLYYWNKAEKRRLLENYFMHYSPKSKSK